jgi:EAL domain-containing protein (putative c-di-GMP-specific phosphodiesterase class I)
VQPIWDFASDRVVGFECLERYSQEPRRSPDKRFAAAAKVGLGVPSELAAIEAALDHARRLPSHIDVSPLNRPRFELDPVDRTRNVASLT